MKARLAITRGYQGCVGLVTRERSDRWGILPTRFHRLNLVSCKIVTGPTRTPRFGVYLTPSMMEQLPDVQEALQRFKGQGPIFLVDLNVDLDNARSSQIQRVADILTEYVIIDLVRHFRQRRRFCDLKN